ncbi:TonB-dependent receptor [Ramlibacter humi]|uniref:TonB-dependent receptor n=1 Tax=Ramlibacter humi TaxID=2530451 RepID=A0A4Z0BRY1_9BURK|nr:TonB-dependent receptor [Ramlibacter humi]TFZ02057.1 TonB-dependent receptor [Ramlibacter humi]
MALAVVVPAGFVPASQAQEAPRKSLGVVTITGGQSTSLPTQVPATMEGVDREQIERSVNATDSEDALRYLPSLLVRKRYVGDYNHAILSSRASGTGNSARSLVYADGILLSNLLGNGVGGLSFPPRWGLVTPEEIDRVDVMYGPFSAAYPGNSAGAVVDYVTRMPTKLEAHAKAGYVVQPFELYGTDATYRAWQTSASIGNKSGDLSWWVSVNRTDSEGQPLTFATRLASAGTPGGAGVPVTGAALVNNSAGAPWYVIGSATQYATRQDHFKVKLAYDFSGTLRATYTLGWWRNESAGNPASYLRNAAGAPVTSGAVSLGGATFAPLTGADFPLTRESLTHVMHGVGVKSRTGGEFDWEANASLYDYQRDTKRQNAGANVPPAAFTGGPGTVADGSGTGWIAFAWRGTWRPQGEKGPHIVDFGVQQDSYRLAYLTSAVPGNWLVDAAGPVASDTGGRTRLRSLWAQDVWSFAPGWKFVPGARVEQWTAYSGFTRIPGAAPAVNTDWPQRRESALSPKAALSWQWKPDVVLKGAVGRAVRFPTVAELYGATSTVNAQFINDPNLRPERSWTGELSAEKDLGNGTARLTFFTEDTRDALYNQTLFDPVANRNVSRVQNVGRIGTQGLEAAWSGNDVWARGLDLNASATYANSVIKENAGFVTTPGDTIGKRQPNIPRWRASMLASFRWNERWSTSIGARYSSRQFRTLDNSDVNGFAYMGVSRFFVVDLRAQVKLDRHLTAAFGIDNVNNDKYWNFHPYPQRSYFAELKADL